MKYLYQWSPGFRSPPRWMAFAYFSAVRGCALFVAFPFNFLVSLAWCIQDRWARLAMAESWIEQEIRVRQQKIRERPDPAQLIRIEVLSDRLSNRTNEFLQLKQKYQTDVAELNQRLIERTDELMRHFRQQSGPRS